MKRKEKKKSFIWKYEWYTCYMVPCPLHIFNIAGAPLEFMVSLYVNLDHISWLYLFTYLFLKQNTDKNF